MRAFSVVCPIHNEERYLRYSLPSIYRLNPNQTILIFDRCSDGSRQLAEKIAAGYGFLDKTRFVTVNQPCDYKFRPGFLRRLGYKTAKHNLILTTSADLVLDPAITEHFTLVANHGMALVSFEYLDYPVSPRNMLKRLLEAIRLPFHWLGGPFVFNRQLWMETENLETVKNLARAEDTHLHTAMLKKYPTKCVLTKTIHLRPHEDPETHYLRGRLYWSVAHRSLLIAFLSSLVLLRPMLMKGYVHERIGG